MARCPTLRPAVHAALAREGIAEIAEIVRGKPVPVSDRNAAERLTNTRLYIERDRLPTPEEDEFYLADLVGLAVVDRAAATRHGRGGA